MIETSPLIWRFRSSCLDAWKWLRDMAYSSPLHKLPREQSPFVLFSFSLSFFHGYLGGTLCLQAITESSSKRTKRFTVFSSSFLFFFRARYFFLLFPLRDFRRANRRGKKLKAWRELSSTEERDGEEERFVEERERISSWEFLRQWWNCYSFRNVWEILFVIFLGSFWLRENCTLQKSLVRGGRKLGVFTRREMSRSLNFNPVSIGNKMKDRL